MELRIVDPDMNDLPHDGKTAGEVVVRTPWLTQGYFKNPEASQALWAGGYLHTDDIGVIAPDGYLRITDRIKDAKWGERPLALVVLKPDAAGRIGEAEIKTHMKVYAGMPRGDGQNRSPFHSTQSTQGKPACPAPPSKSKPAPTRLPPWS